MQRDPKSVAALADQGDVRVRRRDGVPLVLTREDRALSAVEGSVSAARALRNVLAHLPTDVAAEALLDEFPWVDVLPRNEQAQFVRDFVRAFQASAELGQWVILAQTIREWRSTASIHADPVLANKLSGPLDEDFGPVPAPTADLMPAKRGDRVAPPAPPGGWESRFLTSDAAKGWEDLCQTARSNTWEAWIRSGGTARRRETDVQPPPAPSPAPLGSNPRRFTYSCPSGKRSAT